MSEKVKTKVITMMYSWTVSLPNEAKICGAYQMLKSQGERDTNHFKTVKVCRAYIVTKHTAPDSNT